MKSISNFRFYFKLENDLYVKGFSGRIVHGAFLQFIRDYDNELSQKLHEENGRRPYCTTPIRFTNMGDLKIGYFDLKTYDQRIIHSIIEILTKEDEKTIFIIDRNCKIVKIDYSKIIIPEPKLLNVGTEIRLRFQSPTLFANDKRNAKSDPYPHLDVIWRHIIGNYSRIVGELDNNNQLELINKLLNQLSTPHFNIKSKHIKSGFKIKITGFKGTILFKIEKNDGLELLYPILVLLANWGIGGKTTMGFGNVEMIIREKGNLMENKSH